MLGAGGKGRGRKGGIIKKGPEHQAMTAINIRSQQQQSNNNNDDDNDSDD
jgi:hypothetical protein